MNDTLPATIPLAFPPVGQPTIAGTRTDFYDGAWSLERGSPFDADGHPYVVRVAVRKALPRMKYKPAVFAGRRVSQLVQQAVVFRIPPAQPAATFRRDRIAMRRRGALQ